MEKCKKKSNNLKKRKLRVRRKIRGSADVPRLSVYRSLKNTYAQIIDDDTGLTLVSASTKNANLSSDINNGGNIDSAKIVGQELAKKATEKNITSVVFDRGGRKYHGRIKALAEAARKGGLKF